MFLEDTCVFHIMDPKSRSSVGAVVESYHISFAIEFFESRSLSEFWPPNEVVYDRAFATELFESFLNKYRIEHTPLFAIRHNKNTIESKNRIIRDVYLSLKSQSTIDLTETKIVLIQKSFRIINDLNGSDVASVNGLVKSYTRHIENGMELNRVPKNNRFLRQFKGETDIDIDIEIQINAN